MSSVYIQYLREKALHLREIARQHQTNISELLNQLADEFEAKADAIESGRDAPPAPC